jgi:molybdopterin-guanine dinucleotide biosynthesis protein A
MAIKDDISGVILVGGKSRRMGTDKAFLKIDGKTLLEKVTDAFTDNFSSISLIGGKAERFAGYDLPVHEDLYPGSALGGLYTGLFYSSTEYVFVSSCDMPFPNARVINYITLIDKK